MKTILAPSHNPAVNFWVRPESPSDFLVIREIWCENVYEVYDGDIDDTGVVVDIGANIGTFSIYCGTIRPEKITKVIAVEPEPHNYELLVKNIEQNNLKGIVVPVKKAITAKDGDLVFITDEHGGSNIIDKDKSNNSSVRTLTLDTLLKENGVEFVDVLKIDIEGAETDIILSATKATLNLCRYITVEIDSRNDDMGKIVEKLSETHQIKVVGSHLTGGQLYAKRY